MPDYVDKAIDRSVEKMMPIAGNVINRVEKFDQRADKFLDSTGKAISPIVPKKVTTRLRDVHNTARALRKLGYQGGHHSLSAFEAANALTSRQTTTWGKVKATKRFGEAGASSAIVTYKATQLLQKQ